MTRCIIIIITIFIIIIIIVCIIVIVIIMMIRGHLAKWLGLGLWHSLCSFFLWIWLYQVDRYKYSYERIQM